MSGISEVGESFREGVSRLSTRYHSMEHKLALVGWQLLLSSLLPPPHPPLTPPPPSSPRCTAVGVWQWRAGAPWRTASTGQWRRRPPPKEQQSAAIAGAHSLLHPHGSAETRQSPVWRRWWMRRRHCSAVWRAGRRVGRVAGGVGRQRVAW